MAKDKTNSNGKDPAFLFYASDFISGTQFFTDAQVGIYTRLMCAQKLHGHLSEKQMMFICKSYDEDVFEKFEKDAEGKYFNRRLEFEINRRANFVSSRGSNRKKGAEAKKLQAEEPDKPKNEQPEKAESYDFHMENENENENVIKKGNKNVIEKSAAFIKRERKFIEDVLKFEDLDRPREMIDKFIAHWTEPTPSLKKMRFEDEKFFYISKRLATWAANNSKWDSKQTGRVGPKATSKADDAIDRHTELLDEYSDERNG